MGTSKKNQHTNVVEKRRSQYIKIEDARKRIQILIETQRIEKEKEIDVAMAWAVPI